MKENTWTVKEHGQWVQIKIKSEDRCQKMGRRRRRRPKENY